MRLGMKHKNNFRSTTEGIKKNCFFSDLIFIFFSLGLKRPTFHSLIEFCGVGAPSHKPKGFKKRERFGVMSFIGYFIALVTK